MTRRGPARRRWPPNAALLALAAALGLLAACSSGPPPPSAAAAGSSASGGVEGVTDSTVTLGYTVLDDYQGVSRVGLSHPDQGNVDLRSRMIQAYVDYVNGAGGAGGRRLVAETKTYATATASPDQSRALCRAFTQDAKVFAAVLDGQPDPTTLDCYRAARTLMLDESDVPHDQPEYEQYAPYLWSPTAPEYAAYVATQLRTLLGQGYFTGATAVQVLAASTDVARRVTDNVVQPFLARSGIATTRVDYVDPSSVGRLVGTAENALKEASYRGFDRVITVGGVDVVPAALSGAGAAGYASTWAVSTWDAPGDLQQNRGLLVTDRLYAMVGLGYAPALDVSGEAGGPFPDPSRPQEGICKAVLDAAGIVPGAGERADYRTAFRYCDATLFIKAALDRVPPGTPLTAEAFRTAVAAIGSDYTSSLTFGGRFGSGQYASTNAGRVVAFDASCACFIYKGGNVPITAN